METHPYKKFPQQHNNAAFLILGSIPPPRFCAEHLNLKENDVHFFYGSQDNEFWPLFIESMELDFAWPGDYEQLKDWLVENRWCVSDIVLKTIRKQPESASDADLRSVVWNYEKINNLFQENPIRHVFFTSKWVAAKFNQHIKPKLLSLSDEVQFHTLISPSPSGLRRAQWATSVLPRQSGEPLSTFRQRFYTHMLHKARG